MDVRMEMMRQRIATRLEALSLTPITAATGADLPRDTIRNLFRQESAPRVDTLIKIAEALETTVAYLVGETAYPKTDYSDEDVMRSSRAAMETAKPIPVIGYAETGLFEKGRHIHDGEYIDLLYLSVPGFEDSPLQAVFVTDDHADSEYAAGRYVVFAVREVAGLRNGDHIVAVRRKEADNELQFEFTIWELVTQKVHRSSDENLGRSGGLMSLSLDEEKYPNVGFREAHAAGYMTIGVIVADLEFMDRPAEAGMFPGIEAGTRTLRQQMQEQPPAPEGG